MVVGDKMKFFTWHEKLVRKVTERNLNLVITGKLLITFSLGTIFSITLVRYGYFILVAATFILMQYLITNFMQWFRGGKVSYGFHVFGFLGLFLLVLFLGIQSPQVPFKIYILIIGLILTIPAYVNILKG